MVWPEGFIVSAICSLKSWANIQVSRDQLITALNNITRFHDFFEDEFDGIEYSDVSDPGLDTMVRGVVFDVIADYYTSHSGWPLNVDGKEVMEDFRQQLYSKFEKSG